MAQQRNQLDSEKISCSICLDLLKDPVTTSCGHSYCMDCIKTHWDGEDGTRIYSCPQCRKTFTPRPELETNVMLAVLAEELKKTGFQSAADDICYAGPGDVSCDFCTGRKVKAVKSCLVCLVSYCENHLQPHYDVAPLKRHQLVEPSKNLQENFCSSHDEVMKIFCLTDQQLICYLCTLDEHKGHESVPAAAERKKKQKELEVSRLNVQQRIQVRQKDVKLLQRELKAIKVSADKTVEESEKMFAQMIRLIQKRRRDDVTAAVKELRDKIQENLRDTWTNISLAIAEVDVLLSEPQPKTRHGFLKYSREITLDPNTAFRFLELSEGDRKVTRLRQEQHYPDHPDRFTYWNQVLSKESLTGRCYWEVEWRGGVYVSFAYKSICREGSSYECGFGRNDKSWSLYCDTNSYSFWYNSPEASISGPQSSRIGVYLDHRAGILSFYSVSETMTVLHRVQTTFTEPIHAGVGFVNAGDTAEFLKLK
ncbi:tripartite motif-containing protein 16-like [Acanthochromis polyacanthus]|uniref:tripartite motif-containing protein 16-like n=1 Tax=Acanthochromis polyacanthus TaxID=80966 RepID=UPI002234D7EC|nr:tripartite motif-containing protein 16-like [Acanthochromis polyacanthus]